jgi:hypothetical protein
MNRISAVLPLLALTTLVAAGCSDDSPTSPGESSADFRVTIENISADGDFPASGSFSVPTTRAGAGPIGPGEAYEFEVGALPGHYLSFATMFVHSNDLFYAPDEMGIALFDGASQPVSGDVTAQVSLWDAGTELNEEPGVGGNQAPRQPAANTGPPDISLSVRPVADAYSYPDVADVIGVIVTSLGENLFRIRIENRSSVGTIVTSTSESLAVPLAPGVWVVHNTSGPLFTSGSPAGGAGLEALAEDGSADGLATSLGTRTSISSPFAPGVFAVHSSGMPIFTEDAADRGDGLEGLAEDGAVAPLAAALAQDPNVRVSGAFDTPDGAPGPGPALPGGAYSFEFAASEGDYLSFATMFVQSNDLFLAPDDQGLALFVNGAPVTGDVTGQLLLWDAGTEANQWPGVGPDQAPRQSGANVGAADPLNQVRAAGTESPYPGVSSVVRVTITAN